MAEKIVIDPVTRVGGHLKVEVEIEAGKVKEAWVSGTMARGFERLIENKDPRDAQIVMQRICGICPSSHGLAAAQALDQALGAAVPDNGRIIRNLIVGSDWIQSHILHFYHLSALDYLDIMGVANYKGTEAALRTVRDKLALLGKGGDFFPMSPRSEPDEFCVSDPEVVATLVAHYLDALEMRKRAHQLGAIFGGRMPMHAAVVPGGVTVQPTVDKIDAFKYLLRELVEFVNNVYLTDVVALATGALLPFGKQGVGKGWENFMSFGMFDLEESGNTDKPRLLPPGIMMGTSAAQPQTVDDSKITETVKHSWYADTSGVKTPEGGPSEFQLGKPGAYSFVTSPRYEGKPVEVGPMARMLIKGEKTLTDLAGQYSIQYGAVARHVSRAIECKIVAEAMLGWLDELVANIKTGHLGICDEAAPVEQGQGSGLIEAPRGSLGHWISISSALTKSYRCVTPTNFNAGPRDDQGQRGPIEQALVDTPVPDPKNPLNVMRVVRSFDPCLTCAVHIIDPDTNAVRKWEVR